MTVNGLFTHRIASENTSS